MKTIITIVLGAFAFAFCGCTDAPMKGTAGGELSETQPQTVTPREVQKAPPPPAPDTGPVIEP